MAITVKGVEVRADEINLEVKFQDLTEEGQKRIFLENKEDFLSDALISGYPAVRRLLWEPEIRETCSSALLNQAVIQCLENGASVEDIITLLNVPGFELDDNIRKNLIHQGERFLPIKMWIAKDKKTPLKILQDDSMFWYAAKNLRLGIDDDDSKLFETIVLHPHFVWDKEMEKKMESYTIKLYKVIMTRMQELEEKRPGQSFRKDGKTITAMM